MFDKYKRINGLQTTNITLTKTRRKKKIEPNISTSIEKPNLERQLAPHCFEGRPRRWTSSGYVTNEVGCSPLWKLRILKRIPYNLVLDQLPRKLERLRVIFTTVEGTPSKTVRKSPWKTEVRSGWMGVDLKLQQKKKR